MVFRPHIYGTCLNDFLQVLITNGYPCMLECAVAMLLMVCYTSGELFSMTPDHKAFLQR